MLLASVLLFSTTAQAGIGISPGDIESKNLKPGSEYTTTIYISRSDADAKGSIDVEIDFENPEVNNWIRFDQGLTFDLPSGRSNYPVNMTFSPPATADLGEYKGSIRFTLTEENSNPNGDAIDIKKGARLDAVFALTNEDFTELNIRNIELAEMESTDGNYNLLLNVENLGNIATAPSRIDISVLNLNDEEVSTVEITSNIPSVGANSTEEITVPFQVNVQPGQYFFNVQAYLNSSLLREEKLAFVLLGDVPVTEVEETTEEVVTSTGNDVPTWVYIILVVIGTGIVVAGVYYFMVMKDKEDKENKAGVKPSPVAAFLVAVFSFLLSGVIVLAYDNNYIGESDSTVTTVVIRSENRVAGVQDESPREGGLDIEEAALPQVSTPPAVPTQFSVYSASDSNSEVIGTVNQGETYQAVERIDGWYRIEFKGGFGWITTGSVQQN